MSQISLQDIGEKRTRDLLRGLLDKTTALDRTISHQDSETTLSRLLKTVQRSDLQSVDALLRKSPLFQHVKVLPEFPTDNPFRDNRGVSLVPHSRLALDYIALRISDNEAAICKALSSLKRLNLAIYSGIDSDISSEFSQAIEHVGHSLTLARKAALVIGHGPKESAAHKLCTDLVGAYGVDGKNYGTLATIDAIGAEFNYLDIKFRFRTYASINRDASIARKLSSLCFAPLASTEDELISIVTASYEISLIDAAIALLCHVDEGVVQVEISQAVLDTWRQLSQEPSDVPEYFDKQSRELDLAVFRTAPAFMEYAGPRRIRYALQPLFDLQEGDGANSFPRQRAAEYFMSVEGVDDVVPLSRDHEVSITPTFARSTAGMLTRSCGLVWACEKEADFSNISTEDMALLMGDTFYIDRLLSTSLLRRAVATSSSAFVRLILQTLLRAHSSATLDSFRFKDLFQAYIRDHHEGDILEFMKSVQSLDPGIVGYFVNLLDETMLSQMAFLMKSSEAIYDSRARLLEWFSEVTGELEIAQRAKQLRLDRKIAAVRGAINETRLNIDAVRFRQWIEQNKLSEFSDFIRQSLPNLPSIPELTDGSKRSTLFLVAHREPNKLALKALMECYEEFCRSPDYGIASFLGRRIRHGTLRGTLLNGLDLSDREIPQLLVPQYRHWFREFSSSIDALTSRLYFRDKSGHKDGLLSAEIDSEQKWQTCLICLGRIFLQAQQDQGVMFAPILIEQFCWLVFEVELAKVQESIGEARSRWGKLELKYAPGDEVATAFERRINVPLADHFSTVISWFRKPPNISPVAELGHIIEVVIAEAHEEYAAFAPQLTVKTDPGLELTGSTYYVAYDALGIAVRNAAKHGMRPGVLDIVARVKDFDVAKVLEITVTSQLKLGDDIVTALMRIERAGRAGAVDADIVEGLSGIRKLKKMQSELSILSFAPSEDPSSSANLRMTIDIPIKGLVK